MKRVRRSKDGKFWIVYELKGPEGFVIILSTHKKKIDAEKKL